MQGLDNDTCDEVSLKLAGLIGIFDLMVNLSSGWKEPSKSTMLDFAFFISKELQYLYKSVTGVDYE